MEDRHGQPVEAPSAAEESGWLRTLTDVERAEIQRRVDAQRHPANPTAYLNRWWRRFSRAS